MGKGKASLYVFVQGPIANLQDHLANPTVNNGFAAATKFTP